MARPTALLVEVGDADTLDFQQRGHLLFLRSQPSALTELASELSTLASDPTPYQPGMRQLRLTVQAERDADGATHTLALGEVGANT
jgi:hypothetical protein